jgi:hypothetical protein
MSFKKTRQKGKNIIYLFALYTDIARCYAIIQADQKLLCLADIHFRIPELLDGDTQCIFSIMYPYGENLGGCFPVAFGIPVHAESDPVALFVRNVNAITNICTIG